VVNCEAVVERLPWLLNRSLSGAERDEVLAHLATCGDCQEELERTGWVWEANRLHLAPETLVALAAGEAPGEGAPEAIAGHLAACARCSEERDLALAGRSAVVDPRPPRAERGTGGGWRVLAIAASLFGLAILAGYVQQRGTIQELRETRGVEPESPRLNVPVVELSPAEALRGGSEPTELRLPAGAGSVMLILLPGAVPDGVPLRVTLRDAAGEAVWSGTGLERSALGDFTVELPAAILEPGPMRLEIAAAGQEAPSAYYDVTVR
jgi:hypothetical protein